jgi:hypothetical protein
MKKLIEKKNNNLLYYNYFLKNNNLNEDKKKMKGNPFSESILLYENPDFRIIELDSFKIFNIPVLVEDFKDIYSIKSTYKDQKLFNYDLNYNFLYNFNRTLLNTKKRKRKGNIKGRLIHAINYNKEVVIASLGFSLLMKSIDLNDLIEKINNKKTIKKKGPNKNKFGKFFYKQKRKKIKQIIRTYKLRKLNFSIEEKKGLSRITYIEKIIEGRRTKKIKKNIKKKIKINS